MVTMLRTSNSENCDPSLKKDSSKIKRPGYMKQSLKQPTTMMPSRTSKTVNVLPFEKFIYSFFPVLEQLPMSRSSKRENDNEFTCYLNFLGSQHKTRL